jgi:DDE superfamily endonuclease
LPGDLGLDAIEVWFQDEARVGQRGTLTQMWAAKGSRPRAVRQQRFQSRLRVWGGLPCRGQGRRIGYAQSECRKHATPPRFDRPIGHAWQARRIGCGSGGLAHGPGKLLIPANLSILPLPPYSPELNPVEQVWQQLRQSNWANRCFAGYDQIVNVCCQAWNRFASQPDTIRNLCTRQWALLI